VDKALLQTLIEDAGFAVIPTEEREGILGEDTARIVWCTVFSSVGSLIREWQEEQTWLVNLVRARHVSTEKTWELYLVLAALGQPSEDQWMRLEEIRGDTSFARKLVLPRLDDLTPSRAKNLLAPLYPLSPDTAEDVLDALRWVEQEANREGLTDVLDVLRAFRENRPLFEEHHAD
jgi:hypothetical protein